ncbi:cell division protein FtsQ/DivIB [Nocardioides coralli]|uniref:cell division protein FtsQ/DivIB n=1 Tax=Nocardioides coralli TaxID=2872154 RepID=UPI001CA41223|nr:FtsQ-type POTRA domain-containing protein [Nocardioides coralli]QZY27957.1 FtsQ-type POTRA domain-containing protein [Nocardioides coralli]
MSRGVLRSDSTVTASERSRRAFARRQWSRRWLTWRWVLAGVLLLALVVGAGWLFLFSSVLAVAAVEVDGEQHLGESEVREVADVTRGQPLARVDLAAVRSRVRALALVRDVEVTRQWPDTIRIGLEERVAIAVVEIGGRVRGLDLEGVVFDDFGPAAGLPRVQTSADAGRDALREAAAVVASLPDELAATVDHVEVATVDQIELELRDGRRVVWGSAEESELKAEVLTSLLSQRGSTYDVSVPGQPTVRR